MLNFVVNSHSGTGTGQKNLKKIIQYCYENKVEYTVHITGAPGHATRITRALCQNDAHTIVAVGGDGTFHEVLNGIEDFEKTALGFIPSGRGNDYARAAGLSLDPITALKKIVRGEIKRSDFIQVGEKRCLNVAGTGIDVDVLERVAGRKGKLTYLASLIYCVKNFKPYKITVTVNGESHDYECAMVGVCNGIAIGGNIRLSPLSKTDDGKLDVIAMCMPPDGKLIKILPGFVKGKHMNWDITKHFVCDEVSVESYGKPVQLDGEIYRDFKLDCKIVKGGLRTFRVD